MSISLEILFFDPMVGTDCLFTFDPISGKKVKVLNNEMTTLTVAVDNGIEEP